MILCICNNIDLEPVEARLAQGATLLEVEQEFGLGTSCGACIRYLEELYGKNDSSDI